VKGAIHAIKEMELYAKFKEATAAVKTAHLDLKIAKAKLKEKKGDNDNTPQQTGNAVKVMTNKGKKPKKPEGEDAPQAAIAVAKADIEKTRKARMRCKPERTCLVCRFSNSMGIFSLMRLTNPGRKL
jgi:hypothetical protein